MQLTAPLICALANFVLLTDQLRIVGAGVPKTKREDEKYTTEYDNFDIDRVLASERLMKSYIKCLENKGPCTKEGRLLKTYLPDALASDCSKCSEVQKVQGGRVLSHILEFYRDDFTELIDIYDPKGVFKEKYRYEKDDDDNEGDEARRK
ncbi:hypothetical protein FQR65_LT09314 [Abscondita terminalis]|nr:hypothetical protein FQR65_LT09314 [Abscondita terminalis]